jgi:hypothetical protein
MTPNSTTNSQKARELASRSYDLLANGDLAEHMQALRMLDEARALDAEAVMRYEHEVDQYKVLQVSAKKPTTEIYLADEQGNLVQKEVGEMLASVAPGVYFVHFGKKGEKRRVDLVKDTAIQE